MIRRSLLPRLHAILVAGAALLCAACDETNPAQGAATSARPSALASAAPAPAKPAASVADHVELQKFVLTSAVKSKDPADDLQVAKPGQRVYGHVTVRNRTSGPKRISLSFRVNGDERTMVDLDVEKAWSWRTWAYVTLRKDDQGELTVHVFDDHGAEMGTKSIPIR